MKNLLFNIEYVKDNNIKEDQVYTRESYTTQKANSDLQSKAGSAHGGPYDKMRGRETLWDVALPPMSSKAIYFECVLALVCMQKRKKLTL